MRKYIRHRILIIVLSVVVLLAACGQSVSEHFQQTQHLLQAYLSNIRTVLLHGTDPKILQNEKALKGYLDMISDPDPVIISYVKMQKTSTGFPLGQTPETIKTLITQFYPYDGKTPIGKLIKHTLQFSSTVTIYYYIPIPESLSAVTSCPNAVSGTGTYLVGTLTYPMSHPQDISDPYLFTCRR